MIKKTQFIILLFLIFAKVALCQTAISENVSAKIARQMRDTLGLSRAQEIQIIKMNQLIATQKQKVRNTYTSVDSLQKYIQKAEGMRDSLYKKILADKYALYLEKKRNIVNYKSQN